VPRPLAWYVSRAGAMSPRELVWRGASAASLPVRSAARRDPAPPRWDDEAWLETIRGLFEPRREELVAAAGRIAGGELDLWGHRVEVDLRRTEWDGDPLAGVTLPGDRKPRWELHRQQHVVPLAAGATLAGRDDWARAAAGHLLDWVERNPQDGGGLGWSSGYETAHRLVGWAFAVPLLLPALDSAEGARLAESYARQAAFVALRPSRFSSANNHRIAELVGLLAAARLGAAGLAVEPLARELEQQAARQTFRDGGSREQAGGYFLYVLELLWTARLLAAAAGRPTPRLDDRLEGMVRWLEATADEACEPPPVGDDAEDRMLRLDYFGGRRAAEIAGRIRPIVPAEDSVVLASSGYAVLRARGIRVVFDVGGLGFGSLAAHGHADALAVLVDAGGASLLRDSGTGTYAAGEARDRFRVTAAHNTVVLDGGSQAQPLGPHLWGRRFRTTLEAAQLTEAFDAVRASHDGYREARHTRSVVLVKPDLLLVLDLVAAATPREATLVWQPVGERALAVVSIPAADAAEDVGPWSPRYTVVGGARRLTWSARGSRVLFATALSLAASAPVIRLREERGTTVVEVEEPRRVRIVERWGGPAAEVHV
jgi:hypothetical protein